MQKSDLVVLSVGRAELSSCFLSGSKTLSGMGVSGASSTASISDCKFASNSQVAI